MKTLLRIDEYSESHGTHLESFLELHSVTRDLDEALIPNAGSGECP